MNTTNVVNEPYTQLCTILGKNLKFTRENCADSRGKDAR